MEVIVRFMSMSEGLVALLFFLFFSYFLGRREAEKAVQETALESLVRFFVVFFLMLFGFRINASLESPITLLTFTFSLTCAFLHVAGRRKWI
jgi:DNA integrity scanning protein DisA with diadenylate cyclase activity